VPPPLPTSDAVAQKQTTDAPVAPRHRTRGLSFHWLITLIASLAFSCNGIAFAAMSFALPGLRREFGLGTEQLGLISAFVSIGQTTGSLFVGWVADRLGRRVFAVTIALAALATAGGGLATEPWQVLVAFVLAGLGNAGVSPVASSLIGELTSPRLRGPALAWTQVFWTSGWCLTAVGGALLASNFGWRWILALGLLPLGLAIWAWRVTPESPRFLLAHGRRAEAEQLVADLEARYGVRLPLPEQQRARPRGNPLQTLLELWRPGSRKRTFTIWLTWFAMIASFNGPIVWLPAILAGSGASEGHAATLALIVSLFMLPGSFVSVFLIERSGRRPVLLWSLGVGMFGCLGLGFARGDLAIVLAGGALAGGVLAAWPIILGYTAELYPTRVRASAAGWAAAFSRLGGVFGPWLLGALLGASGGLALSMGVFAALLAAAVVVVKLLGEETRGRTLEELSG
jgi:putative MFS transporter